MSTDGSYEVNLLCAKSRVAPLPNRRSQGNTTLPRLELSGALLFPEWLCQPSSAWPSQNPCLELPNQELEERIVVHVGQEKSANPIFRLRLSFVGLVRLVAYLRRFWYNCNPTHRALRRVGYLRTSELQEATQVLIRSAQRESVGEEIKDLQRSGQVKRSLGLKALCPIIHDGVMRIGGRLRNAPVSYDRKHPIILAASHPLTLLIVQHYHRNLLHTGQQLMISTIREKYWPLRIRNLVRRVVHEFSWRGPRIEGFTATF
uniref:Integrase_H2C2 domain-containing protein n=1 Tax=Anopheles minimus TaxID=112268 RepID=A0A182VPU2_9DIPT